MVGTKKPVTLIVGGTSGLGLEMARQMRETHAVVVTGRKPTEEFPFHYFNMGTQLLGTAVRNLISKCERIDTLVIAAGYLQKGVIDTLKPGDIVAMVQTNLTGPALLVREILLEQDVLPNLICVTSTSEWMPRLDEPVYAATKRGMAGLAESLAEDSRIGKTLVVAPSKMATPFWTKQGGDEAGGLPPQWVATQALGQLLYHYVYRHVAILRDPARLEVRKEKKIRG